MYICSTRVGPSTGGPGPRGLADVGIGVEGSENILINTVLFLLRAPQRPGPLVITLATPFLHGPALGCYPIGKVIYLKIYS